MRNWWDSTDVEEAKQKVITVPWEATRNGEAAQTVAIILDGIPCGNSVLEIGAGIGRLMKPMVGHFQQVLGVDSSASMVRFSRDYLAATPQCCVVLSDGSRLPFPDALFDFVYSFICFQHMHTLESVQANIAEAYRVLRPGGFCRIQTVSVAPFESEVIGGQWGFPNPQDFLAEFQRVGFSATLTLGLTHFQHIWVTATK